MDRPRVTYLLPAFTIIGLLTLVGIQTGATWTPFLGVLWAAAVGGPTALVLLAPTLARDGRRWVRLGAVVLPGACVAAALQEALAMARLAPAPEQAAGHAVALLTPLSLVVLSCAASAWLVLRVAADVRRAMLRVGAGIVVLSFIPGARLVVFPVVFALEAGGLLVAAGFVRPPRVWARAALAGALTLAAGLVVVAALMGDLLPRPALALDDPVLRAIVLPLAALTLLVFAGGLLLADRSVPSG